METKINPESLAAPLTPAIPSPVPPRKSSKKTWLMLGGSVIIATLVVGILVFIKKPNSNSANIATQPNNAMSNTSSNEMVVSGPDADNDGLSDSDEAKYGTDPKNPDTDGDTYNDGDEIKKDFDPLGPGNIVTASVSDSCQGGSFVFNPETTAAETSSSFNQVNVEIIIDGSGSMLENIGGEKKIDAAKRIVNQIVDSLPNKPNLNVGLRAYGFQSPGSAKNCQDSKLLVPIKGVDKSALKNATSSITAKGYTPIAYSLQEAAKDFPVGEKNFNTVILISDGIESCGGNPAEIAKHIYQQTGLKINTHVVGFGVGNNDAKLLEGIAQNSGGTYNTAKDVDDLNTALTAVIKKVISGGTLHIVYRDSNNQPFKNNKYWLTLDPKPQFTSEFDRFLDDNGEIKLALDPGTYTFKVDIPGIQQQDVAKPREYKAVIKEGYETYAQISLGKVQVLFPKVASGAQPTIQGGSMELRDLCSEKQDNAISVLSKNWPQNAFNNINNNIIDAEVYPGLYRVDIKGPRAQKVVLIESLKTTTVDYSNFFGILSFSKPIFNFDYPNLTQMSDSTFVFPCCGVVKAEEKRGSYYSPGRDYYSVYAFPGTYEISPSIRGDMLTKYKATVTVRAGQTLDVNLNAD